LRSTEDFASDASGRSGSWTLKNEFPLFLNQCTIQSFLFLLLSLRDLQTVTWLENFTQPTLQSRPKSARALAMQETLDANMPDNYAGNKMKSKLLRYHGLAVMNTTLFPTWDHYFKVLLEQEPTVFIIESQAAFQPEYELEINPASLCSRLISVRAQIAQEWVHDLGVVAEMGRRMLDRYWDRLRQLRESEEDGTPRLERESLLFLESNPSSDPDSDLASVSPLRKGNFDLLLLLATQESIHRVLNNEDRSLDPASKASNMYLRDFYAQRLLSHFTGPQRYGRADDFLEELLDAAPRLQTGEGFTTMIDPIRIAELILKEREQVALEWREIAKAAPQDHFYIKRLQLNILMGIGTSQDAGSGNDS